jgi:hypothetical protein
MPQNDAETGEHFGNHNKVDFHDLFEANRTLQTPHTAQVNTSSVHANQSEFTAYHKC